MLVPLSEIFDFQNGTSLELINCDLSEQGIPFISRTSESNGVSAHILALDNQEPLRGNCITVALGGSVLSSFYQSKPFYTSFHIQCLYSKNNLSEQEMLFYCAAIEANKYRYNYGRQANKTLKDIRVPAPANIPKQIKSYQSENNISAKSVAVDKMLLNTDNWRSFVYSDLFHITTSKDDNLVDATEGETPYISSTQMSNGISQWINCEPTHDANTISVARNGSVGSAFFHSYSYAASPDDVRIFKPKFNMNKYIAIFLITLIEKEKYRYAYGRKFGTKRMQGSQIKLPVNDQMLPDWDFMERYIKSLPYSSNL